MEPEFKECTGDTELLPETLDNVLKLSDHESQTHSSPLADTLLNNNAGACSDTTQDKTEEDNFFDCEETLENEPQEEEDEFDLKEDQVSEFNEEYLKELEKDLTQEEKQSRKDESMQLKEGGNEQFKKGEYVEAEDSYTKALTICPFCYEKERSILYSNRAAARMKMDKKEEAISDCTKAIELNPNYIRAILRRAELHEKTEKLDEALDDYKTIVEKDPSVTQAVEACMRLPKQIEERNEKLKVEMMSKLKDLGNMFLRPLGLSTENFQVNQDPSSGSYSVNFVQNPNNNR
ncbi:tetratricopeptide repeat protein 1-like [Polyodon spathula]|uniref:tetratricopeptide repeat protein 1-like n=1 Tax=Polyodon spathula TaxID=7913 RepID=UPI001B7F0DE7|nr:tetratricopeptide repeat protein 1-like [Polyodon spathula]